MNHGRLCHLVLAAGLAIAPGASGCSRSDSRKGPAPAPTVVVDRQQRAVTVSGIVAKQGTYDVLGGAIEYVLVCKGGKDYETVFAVDCQPQELYDALLELNYKPGQPAGADERARGRPMLVHAEYRLDAKTVRRPIDEFVVHLKDGSPLKPRPWTFTGSVRTAHPQTGQEVLLATLTQSLIGLYPADASPLFQNPRLESIEPNLYGANVKEMPAAGTPVRITFQRVPAPPGHRRARAVIAGRVQYVGFCQYLQRQARQWKLTGQVRRADGDRLELVVEGPDKDVASLLQCARRGPRNARIDSVLVQDEPVECEFDRFEIVY